MKKEVYKILVSAIANHGEKIATNDSYCQVYLSGYMADHPDEKKLLVSLRSLGLPEALIAHKEMTISESDLHLFINKLETKHTEPSDLAWGIDAWAAAISAPELMRQNIQMKCFPNISSELNSDLSFAYQSLENHSNTAATPDTKTKPKLSKVIFSYATAAGIVSIISFQVFASYQLSSKKQTQTTPTADLAINQDNLNEKNSDVALVETVAQTTVIPAAVTRSNTQPKRSSSSPTALIDLNSSQILLDEPTKEPKFKVVLIHEPTQKEKPQRSNFANVTSSLQKTKRLNQSIEDFLKQGN